MLEKIAHKTSSLNAGNSRRSEYSTIFIFSRMIPKSLQDL